MSYHSDYHKGPVDDDDEEEEDYSDEDEQPPPQVPYKTEGYNQPAPAYNGGGYAPPQPQTGYSQPQPQAQPPQQGYDPNAPPRYDVYAEQSYPTSGSGYQPDPNVSGYSGVGYQPGTGAPAVNLQGQDPNKSRESNDTFV